MNVYKYCVGPGRNPDEEKCLVTTGSHVVPKDNVDVLSYNGIRNWRCSVCFEQHRQTIEYHQQIKTLAFCKLSVIIYS